MHKINDAVAISGSDLQGLQGLALDRVLAEHAPVNPATLTFACLRCGSIGETSDQTSRDMIVEFFDPTCCGLTVLFHTNPITLRNVIKLANGTPVEGV